MIFYFSGTGNSRWVALRMAERLGEQALNLAELDAKTEYAIGKGQRVGFVFPVFAWGAPRIVTDFARRVRVEGGFAFAVCTCASEAGYAVQKLAKVCPFASGYSLIMPSNYIIDSHEATEPAEAKALIEAAKKRIAEICDSIAGEKREFVTEAGRHAWLKSHLVSFGFNTFARRTKPFRVTADKCTSCGLCERICPVKAITLKAGKPVWTKPNCTICLGCLNRCPTAAIEFGKNTEGKRRYVFPGEA